MKRGKGKKTEIRQSSPRHGREGSRWHRLASVVQAPASHTTPTQQQNQKKKREQPSQHNVHNKQGEMRKKKGLKRMRNVINSITYGRGEDEQMVALA